MALTFPKPCCRSGPHGGSASRPVRGSSRSYAPAQVQVPDATEGSYAARLARDISRTSHHDAQFEVLHGKHPGKAIADFADSIEASLIVASTHGRTGLARLTLGSVAMEIVRHAPCPVVLTRPPTLQRVSPSDRQDFRHCARLISRRGRSSEQYELRRNAMKAAVVHEFGGPLVVEEVATPGARAGSGVGQSGDVWVVPHRHPCRPR